MDGSLVKQINKYYLLFGVVLFLTKILFRDVPHQYFYAINALTFFCFGFLLWFHTQHIGTEYGDALTLAATVMLYSIVFVFLFHTVSDLYDGDNMLFSKTDANLYKKLSGIAINLPFSKWKEFFSYIWHDTSDWGAFYSISLIRSIFPQQAFLNLVYILMNTVTAYFMFSVGRKFMANSYAFMAALAYGTSSYTIFFEGSFLKETILVFLIVTSIYLFYNFFERRNYLDLLLFFIVSSSVFLFRPPLVFMLWLSCASSFIKKGSNKLVFVMLLLIIGIILMFVGDIFQDNFNRFTNNGDFSTMYVYSITSWFDRLTSYAGALVGPFPTISDVGHRLTYKPFFSSGLLYKCLLAAPFWMGFYICIKRWSSELFPIFLFCFLEMMALCALIDGLEIRKAMPHLPLYYLAAFWFMSEYDKYTFLSDESEEHHDFRKYKKLITYSSYVMLILALVWNFVRTKESGLNF